MCAQPSFADVSSNALLGWFAGVDNCCLSPALYLLGISEHFIMFVAVFNCTVKRSPSYPVVHPAAQPSGTYWSQILLNIILLYYYYCLYCCKMHQKGQRQIFSTTTSTTTTTTKTTGSEYDVVLFRREGESVGSGNGAAPMFEALCHSFRPMPSSYGIHINSQSAHLWCLVVVFTCLPKTKQLCSRCVGSNGDVPLCVLSPPESSAVW